MERPVVNMGLVRVDAAFEFEAVRGGLDGFEDTGRSRDLAADEVRRLVFFGEAIRAAEKYCGMSEALLRPPFSALSLLNSAWHSLRAERPSSGKEEFALYFLSLISRRLTSDVEYQAFRKNALRYLADHRAELAPEIGALYPQPQETTAIGYNSNRRLSQRGTVNAMPRSSLVAQPKATHDFVDAFLSLRHNLERRPKTSQPLPSPTTPPRLFESAQEDADGKIATELKRIQTTRLRAIRHLRQKTIQRQLAIAGVSLFLLLVGWATFSILINSAT